MHSSGIYFVIHGTGESVDNVLKLFSQQFAEPVDNQEFNVELHNIPSVDKDLVFFHYVPQSSLFTGYLNKVAHVHLVIFETSAEEQAYATDLQNQLELLNSAAYVYCSKYESPKTLSFSLPENQNELDELIADACNKVDTLLESEKLKAQASEP